MSADLASAPAEALPSALADLGRVPLGEMRKGTPGLLLDRTLARVLPEPEVQAIPVASFNSGI